MREFILTRRRSGIERTTVYAEKLTLEDAAAMISNSEVTFCFTPDDLQDSLTIEDCGEFMDGLSYAPYGFCPVCKSVGVSRERRPNGDDICTDGHRYPSTSSKPSAA